MKRAERSIAIKAPAQRCFDALVDYETTPEWQGPVRSCEVLTRDGDGRGRKVAFEVDAKVKTVSYVLEYSYDEPALITWDFVEGDVKDVDGDLTLEERDGSTLATYSVAIDPGVWVPGPVLRALNEQVMKGFMDDLKAHVEAVP